MQVRKGRSLHWPEGFYPEGESLRGLAGYVVDLDAPHEQEWCGGLLHVLEPAPIGAVASPLNLPRAKRMVTEAHRATGKAPKVEAASAPSVGGAMPKVEMPRKVAAR